MTTKKVWTYHKSFSFTIVETNIEVSYNTALYQIGVYFIINGNPALQGGNKPSTLQNLIRKLKKQEKEGIIKDLKLGMVIRVTEDENGLYKEVES